MSEPILLRDSVPPAVRAVEARKAAQEENWHLITHFSGLALQGLIAGQGFNVDPRTVAHRAVDVAFALVEELAKRRAM